MSAQHRVIRSRKQLIGGRSRVVCAAGKRERVSPGPADCDPRVPDSKLTLTPYVTMFKAKKPRMPLLASMLSPVDAKKKEKKKFRSAVEDWRPVSCNCLH